MDILQESLIRGLVRKVRQTREVLVWYGDITLHARVLICLSRVFAARKSRLLTTANVPIGADSRTLEEVRRYVRLWLHIARRFRLRVTCFTRSVLLCRVLRTSGIEAGVSFGVIKNKQSVSKLFGMAGHCWVEEAGEEDSGPWTLVLRYP